MCQKVADALFAAVAKANCVIAIAQFTRMLPSASFKSC